MACRVDELRNVGDTWVYEVASLSFVIVRSDPQTIKAFYNSCLHRGRPLRDCPGQVSHLKCPFHGFTWGLDGGLRGVPAREEFPTVTNEAFRLPEAKVALWGGFRSEEHTSELQSLMRISYAVFCLKKKQKQLRAKYTTLC